MTTNRMAEPQPRTVLLLFAALALLTALPVLSSALPPILDYPNHLARMHVLATLPGGHDLARYYAQHWAPIPNLAMDAVVPWLARIVPLEAAGRAFLLVILLGAAGGALALHRATFGRWSAWPLAAFLLLYNRMLLWGFLNYLAGVTLALWALALWIALDGKRPLLQLALGAILGLAVYFAHLAAFGVYVIALIGLAARARPGESWSVEAALPRILAAAVTLFPALALFPLSPTSGAPAAIGYGNPLRKLDLPVSIFDNYNRIFDGATFGLLLVAVLYGLARRRIAVAPALRWSLIGLIVAYLVVPSRFLSASGIDHRLPVAIALVFVGASDWSAMSAGRRKRVGVALALLFAVRLGVVEAVWLKADREYAQLMPAIGMIDRGERVAVAAPPRGVQAGGVPLLHFPILAVARRDAFVPTLFADPAQQPVVFTRAATELAASAPALELWERLAHNRPVALPGFDALMIVDPPRPLDPAILPGPVVFDSPRLILVRIARSEFAMINHLPDR